MNEKTNNSAWPSALADLVDVIENHLTRAGRVSEDAREIAQGVTIALAEYFGGRQVYIPRGESLKRFLRDTEIYKLSGKMRAQDIADKFGVSFVTVYKVIREQRALRRNKID